MDSQAGTKGRGSNAMLGADLDKLDYHTRRRLSNTITAGMGSDAKHLADLYKQAAHENLEVDSEALTQGAIKHSRDVHVQSVLTSFDKDSHPEQEVSYYSVNCIKCCWFSMS